MTLNSDRGGGEIHADANYAEVARQDKVTITGEEKKIPEWMKEGAKQKDKDILCEFVNIYTPDGKTELIKNARVQFVYGRRYGLIGPNGKGKTTLIRHVSEYLLPGFPKHLRVVHVAQHADIASGSAVLEHVVASDEERAYLEAQKERLLNLLENEDGDDEIDTDAINDELEKFEQRLEDIDARRAENRASAILSGLGFTADMQKAQISSLSGGWRQRVALACALFVAPDILMLDEPTNHLDCQSHATRTHTRNPHSHDDHSATHSSCFSTNCFLIRSFSSFFFSRIVPAVTWLTEYLKNVEHTLLVVSHDREFLNNIITDVIDLTEQRLDYYKGDYTNFLKRREEAWTMKKRLYENQQKKMQELKEFINEVRREQTHKQQGHGSIVTVSITG